MPSPPLTPNAITHMLSLPHAKTQHLVVQITQVTASHRQNTLQLQLHDGHKTIKARLSLKQPFMDITKIGIPYGDEPKYRIAVNQHITHNFEGTRILQIISYTPLEPPDVQDRVIGGRERVSPKGGMERVSAKGVIERMVIKQNNQDDVRKGFKEKKGQEIVRWKQDSPQILSHGFRQQRPQRSIIRSQKQNIDEQQVKDYQQISDLYVDFVGWKLVVRIVDKSYKQFLSKTGKLTKVCNLQLMDRSCTKIQASLFGDQAKTLHNSIVVHQLYKIQNGQVKQNSYNQQRDSKHSHHTILLGPSSQLTQLTQQGTCIPKHQDPSLTISKLLQKGQCDKQYQVVGIMLELSQEREIEKDGRTIYKQRGLLGDPITQKSIEVILWNRNIEVDSGIVNKTVVLKNFKLTKYRQVVSLSSVFKSQIKLHQNHPFNSYQQKQIPYIYCSSPDGQTQNISQRICKTIKDLQQQIRYMSTTQTLHSDLQVWLTFVNLKGKWHYGACNNPKCKRAAQSYARCVNCGSFNAKIARKFIIPIQLSDWTGSLWVTAFDDFSGDIFRGWNIDDLIGLGEGQLREECQRRMFRQFTVRVATRRQNGVVRHTIVGRPVEVAVEKAVGVNIQRIRRAIG